VKNLIPLRDSTYSHSFPIVTISIIVVNLFIFFLQITSPYAFTEQLIYNYAFFPSVLTERLQTYSIFGLFYLPLISSIFLHGGWFHVLFNMLYLWIFGDNIEDRLGHLRFLLFYLAMGAGANLIYYMTAAHSTIPLIGASGAIAGMLGAYIITFPRAKITTLIIIFVFITIRKIPAVYFLLFWFLIQVFNASTNAGLTDSSVAWWAHIGGFLLGFLCMPLLSRKNQSLV
jgi:membrane associated rhomboid family serine protease